MGAWSFLTPGWVTTSRSGHNPIDHHPRWAPRFISWTDKLAPFVQKDSAIPNGNGETITLGSLARRRIGWPLCGRQLSAGQTGLGRKLPVRQSWQYDPTKGGLSPSKGALVTCVAACLVSRTSRYRPRKK
jgi:hypothetical protein